jgi:hypothetical protein
MTNNNDKSRFSLSNIYWVILVPLFFILLTIFIWCFYFHFVRAFLSRRKLVYVEVQTYKQEEDANDSRSKLLSRKQAKSNLKLVIETTTGLKLENERFDRYWFDERRGKLTSRLNSAGEIVPIEHQLNGMAAGYIHYVFKSLINNHTESLKNK